VWLGLTTAVLLATASYDLCLSPLVWNPGMGTCLAKIATALVLLDWHRGSAVRVGVTAAIAWAAVQAYTGAVFVAVGVFAAIVWDPLVRRNGRAVRRNLLTLTAAVGLLQVPYAIHQISTGFSDPAMGAVTGSVVQVATGGAVPQLGKSIDGWTFAFDFIQVRPWEIDWSEWLLAIGPVVVALRYWRDPGVLCVTVVPALAAIAGYSLFLAGLEPYYYLSLMPSVVLTLVLAATAVPWRPFSRTVSIALSLAALALVPHRLAYAATLHKMPEYGLIVEQSRQIVGRGVAMREIETEFKLPRTSDPTFVYRILGGRLDPDSPWIAVMTSRGVTFKRADDR
jgi:hypothetical protein